MGISSYLRRLSFYFSSFSESSSQSNSNTPCPAYNRNTPYYSTSMPNKPFMLRAHILL